ncbi:MAG: septal ring lytic transglycosylase RlpA family protein [Microscillaceae bacterium]|jgi:rare lipoprotein A|nr:septal ring lytic transglycosylase RlpA family protein [Microscillaceae bacterium]
MILKQSLRLLVVVLMITFLGSACSLGNYPSNATLETNLSSGKVIASGEASYYGGKFQGRRTASGEKFDKNKLTAAHKTLAFNTKVEVKNMQNGKTVVVKINDRMPKKNKRVIDLSEAAARQLDMLKSGVVSVELKIVK